MDEAKRKAIEMTVNHMRGEWPEGYKHIGGLVMDSGDTGDYTYKCTRAEFEQVKAELKLLHSFYVMTGRSIEFNDFLRNTKILNLAKITAKDSRFNWRNTLEERPKPNLDELSEREPTPELRELMRGDWHERGDLPPVGEVVEVAPPIHNSGDKVRVICYDENASICRYLSGDSFGSVAEFIVGELRPLRNERDELVDELVSELVGEHNLSRSFYLNQLAGKIIDAGWRPTKGE